MTSQPQVADKLSEKLALQRRSRYRFVIERDFQYRFTIRICLIAGLIYTVIGGINIFYLRYNYESLINHATIQMPSLVPQLEHELRFLTSGVVASLILMISTIFYLGLILTHRVAGPLYALKKRLQDFIQGRHPVRLHLRSKDEFRGLEELFNMAMESHDEKQRFHKAELEKILQLIKSKSYKEAEEEIATHLALMVKPAGT